MVIAHWKTKIITPHAQIFFAKGSSTFYGVWCINFRKIVGKIIGYGYVSRTH